MNLFELFVKIGVDDQASKNISNIAGKLGNGLKTAAKVGTAAVATVTAAATAMTAAFIKGTSEVAQYGDNIDKMSQKMGLSAEAYQEWDFIMQHSGTSMEALKAGMKTLANAVESGNDAFERLGITQEEIAAMNQEELFARTLEGLQGVTDETERTYLAGQLLGRGATELGALLNTSAEDVEAMRQQVHDLGGVMSNEAVKAAAAYQDSLQNMQTAFAGIQRGMLSEFLPSMVTVMDGLALIFSGNDSGIAKITEGVNQFADKLMEAVPKIFELGEGILSSLATAILDNLPTLTSTATRVIIKLVDGIVSALPVLAESAIEIIGSLTQGLSDSLPTIIDSAVELINTLANGIIELLPQIIALGLDLIVSLANGIAESLPELIPTVVDVVLQIVKTLTDPTTLSNLVTAALQIIKELASGLIKSIPSLVDATVEIIMGLAEFLKDPSSLSALIDSAVEIIFSLVDALMNSIEPLLDAAVGIIMALVEYLLDPNNLEKLVTAALEIVFKLAEALTDSAYMLLEAAIKLIASLVKFLFDPQNMKDMFESGARILTRILDGFASMYSRAGKSATDFFKKIWDALKSTDWIKLGKDIVNGILDGLSGAWGILSSWFSDAWGGLVDGVGGFFDNLFGDKTDGSHFSGLNYVPYDGYIAELHKGERVLTAAEAQKYNEQLQQQKAVTITQNIYASKMTPGELMSEAIYNQKKAVLLGV